MSVVHLQRFKRGWPWPKFMRKHLGTWKACSSHQAAAAIEMVKTF